MVIEGLSDAERAEPATECLTQIIKIVRRRIPLTLAKFVE